MAYEYASEGSLDYYPCRYGQSKLLFRGPRRRLEGAYAAVLGGTETYGKFVVEPFPTLLEGMLDLAVVNFGYVNAGADVFANEPVIIDACSRAKVTVIQLMGAQNMSNRFYAVHPRRNDRFLRASNLMKTVFREVDFTEFHFTRHMLSALKAVSEEKFALVEDELKSAWTARMRTLLQKIEGKTVLLWISGSRQDGQDDLGPEPLMVDDEMVASIRPFATELVHVTPSSAARNCGTEDMRFAPLEEPAAAAMPGPRVHEEVAEALAPVLRRVLKA
ncbi:DUF6473 family protein [Defluviimonas sp. WL0050]|uniref:DUF6473 family protein n=1 Tax=Albidovulum litorale TaxID=2984134 RepID=A0ABT2ZM93_9RHOB|nr:DUF6473 family protein [Defluviimonas sp. WL0050]MCV2872255.1 DUF6473 family protein [Defluviimonas sp. WL0050]